VILSWDLHPKIIFGQANFSLREAISHWMHFDQTFESLQSNGIIIGRRILL